MYRRHWACTTSCSPVLGAAAGMARFSSSVGDAIAAPTPSSPSSPSFASNDAKNHTTPSQVRSFRSVGARGPKGWAVPAASATDMTQRRFRHYGVVGNRLAWPTDWWRCYPEIIDERWRDMYHSYYPYLFEHGDKMSLYPKIPTNPREWQPGQLQTTYDAIREDKYDAFIRLRKKFPELYEDTHLWDNPVPFGEFNQFYSVRFGMIGMKAFTSVEFDEHGNEMELTAFWFPDNQVISHSTTENNGHNSVLIGCQNVPLEFHKPYITASYKAAGVPVKQVSGNFRITPDAFVPVGTKLDVRHFKVGQEVDIRFREHSYGLQGVMERWGHDGAHAHSKDSKFHKRAGGISAEGLKRVLPGTKMAGTTGGGQMRADRLSIYRIDYKNQLIYIHHRPRMDVGTYAMFTDTTNLNGMTMWNTQRGKPHFPTFIPAEDEDLSTATTDDCQLVSIPLFPEMRDEHKASSRITTADIEDSKSAKTPVVATKSKVINLQEFKATKKKHFKQLKELNKRDSLEKQAKVVAKQQEVRRHKLESRRRVK